MQCAGTHTSRRSHLQAARLCASMLFAHSFSASEPQAARTEGQLPGLRPRPAAAVQQRWEITGLPGTKVVEWYWRWRKACCAPCWAATDGQPRPNRAHMATHCGDGNAPPWPAKTGQHARASCLTSCLRRALGAAGCHCAFGHLTAFQELENTEKVCTDAGLQYPPIVLEAQGGHSRAAASFIHRLADAVASAEGADTNWIRTRLFEQLAVAIARANVRAVRRRRDVTGSSASHLAARADLAVSP